MVTTINLSNLDAQGEAESNGMGWVQIRPSAKANLWTCRCSIFCFMKRNHTFLFKPFVETTTWLKPVLVLYKTHTSNEVFLIWSALEAIKTTHYLNSTIFQSSVYKISDNNVFHSWFSTRFPLHISLRVNCIHSISYHFDVVFKEFYFIINNANNSQ